MYRDAARPIASYLMSANQENDNSLAAEAPGHFICIALLLCVYESHFARRR